MTNQKQQPGEEENPLPFIAPARPVAADAPFEWLKQGYHDIRRAPRQSLGYGATLALLSIAIALGSYQFGTLALYLGLASGFFLVGPVVALALYSISSQLERGRNPELGYCLRQGGRFIRDLMVFSFVLLIVFMIWARSATAMHIFFPENSDFQSSDLIMFLGIGTAVGAVFSAVVFTASAFSLPMILDRKTDAITAVITSVNAVLRNKRTMLVWGSLIVVLVLIGFLTFFIGLVFILPLIGHATWHAYRDTIDASQWPENEKV